MIVMAVSPASVVFIFTSLRSRPIMFTMMIIVSTTFFMVGAVVPVVSG